MLKLAAILALALGLATVTYAHDEDRSPTAGLPDLDHHVDLDRHDDPDHHWKHVHSAPEIDPAGAAAGLTLLLGGLAVLRGRGRGK